MISKAQIEDAYRLISPHVRRTPVIEVAGTDFGVDEFRWC